MIRRVNNHLEEVSEDIFYETEEVLKLKKILNHWKENHNYHKNDWTGIERLYFWIATFTEIIAITDFFTNGNDKGWKIIIPHKDKFRKAIVVKINCTSHDYVNDISISIFSTNEINLESITWIKHKDHFKRVMLWLEHQTNEYEYMKRIEMANQLIKIKNKILPELIYQYQKNFNEKPFIPETSVAVNDWFVREESIACVKFPGKHIEWAVITVCPKAWKKGTDYLEEVMKHELIHLILGKENGGHNEDFKALAKEMNLPEKYQD